MKKYLYVICLVAAFGGMVSCSKNSDPAPTSPVIGRWELNRGLLSGFPAASNVNGVSLDLYLIESFGATIDVFADNTFNTNYKNITVDDAPGTWDFTNNKLTLKYDVGDSETYTYAKNKNIEELTIDKPVSYTISPTASTTVVGQLTVIYRK